MRRKPIKPLGPHVKDETLVREWAREMLQLKQDRALTYRQIGERLGMDRSAVAHILNDSARSGIGASHQMMARFRAILEPFDASKRSSQIGCGYCAHEKTCEIREPRVNKALLGCQQFKHHEQA